jgi:hypothetical protein
MSFRPDLKNIVQDMPPPGGFRKVRKFEVSSLAVTEIRRCNNLLTLSCRLFLGGVDIHSWMYLKPADRADHQV